MPLLLFLIVLLGVPLIEIAVFIEVGGAIGLWSTLAIILIGTVVGVWLVRTQGLSILARAREQMDAGILPERELFDALCLALAGILVFIPGFVTDSLGVLLIIPPVRGFLFAFAGRRLQTEGHVYRDGRREGVVIEGEYRDVTRDDEPKDPGGDRLP